jgi:hypothetical protein
MKDQTLAKLIGTTTNRIRSRRMAFGIAPFTVDQLIEPFRDLLGVQSDTYVARLSGVSLFSVTSYREEQGILAKPRPIQRTQRIPASHPVRPYKTLLGLVPDQEVANLAGVPVATVKALRESFSLEPATPLPESPKQIPIQDCAGPWIGYESLFGRMSSAKISRAVGVPFSVVEQRQAFLGVPAFQRVSRLARYEYLLGLVSNGVLAKLAGVSPSRVALFRKQKASMRESS